MTLEKRGLVFLPTPQIIDLKGRISILPARLFSRLEPTRKQLSQLPPAISLSKSADSAKPQSYELLVSEDAVQIRSSSEIGWHYGLLTLRQLAQGTEGNIPQCHIKDWPDFEHRGMLLDISRNKVPKLETLCCLIDQFAQWKITQLQLYIEHTFTYRGHETVWKEASPLTQNDIRKLDAFCHERFIELVPNLNCFGHMSRWLVHDEYRHLAENPQGGETDFGFRPTPQGLCPIDPGSLVLAEDLIHQMVSAFTSKQVNVGCDETIDLGYGRSKDQVKKHGRGPVYLAYLKKIHRICEDAGYTMQFWADILLKYPDLIEKTPKNSIPLNWGYEATHPFESETLLLGQLDSPFFVCPGTASWNSLGGRTKNMEKNISKAAVHGYRNGASGFMITDWGDNGHWQPLATSFPGFVFGASKAWNSRSHAPLEALLDQFVFESEGWGKLLLHIGDLDQALNLPIHNRSILFTLLQEEAEVIKKQYDPSVTALKATRKNAEELKATLKTLASTAPVEPIIARELEWVLDMQIHACRRGIQIFDGRPPDLIYPNALELRERHKEIWDFRNRPGGYRDSRALFEVLTQNG